MNEKTHKSNLYNAILICLVITSIFVGGGAFFLTKKQEISELENRRLASPPSLSVGSFASGRAADEINVYVSDHFPARKFFVKAHTIAELALGKRESNSVIAARKGALCAREATVNRSTLERNAEAATEFLKEMKARGKRVCVGIIPEQIDVFATDLPRSYGNRNSELIYGRTRELFPSINICDFSTIFAGRGDKVYYRSDHHWNSDGAYEAYCEVCHALDIVPFTKESFSFELASDSFYGSAASRFGIRRSSDTITLPRFQGDTQYVRRIGDAAFGGFYDLDKLSGGDKYSVFLGGNAPLIEITLADPSQSESRPNMLLFRDSYSSALAPYLARHFNLTLCDSRYYKGSAIELAEKAEPRYALVLLGVEGFVSDDISDFFALP